MTEWRETTLGEVITLQRGFDLTEKSSPPGPYPVISSGGVSYTTEVAKVEGPGVVTGRKGVLGKVHYSHGPYWPHDTTLWVKDFKGSNPRYVYYLLQTLPLASLDAGASNPTLNRNHAHLLVVRVPDLRTQERISAVLGGVDDLIDRNRHRIGLLEQLLQATYREWFVNFRYPGHRETVHVDSPIGPIPEGWEVVAASALLDVNPRLRLDRDAEHAFITMGDLDEKSMNCFASGQKPGTSGAKFQNGDTLFARITPCLENGKTGLVQCLTGDEIGRGSTEFIVLRGRMVGSAFTYFLARDEQFRRNAIQSMSGASGRQRVRNECFDSYLVPAPPTALARCFEQLCEPLLAMVYSLGRSNQVLSSIGGHLLPELVSGQIDVSSLHLEDVAETVA
jgi:type I restriction enzyme, S subunit